MRIIDRLLGRDPDILRTTARIAKTTVKSLAEQVYDAPATFNRRARRAVKHPFRWLSPAQQTGDRQALRYFRRHGNRMLATDGTKRTRRERREAARITRLILAGR